MKKTRMSYLQAKYLKHAGDKAGLKVSLVMWEGKLKIHIRDFEFFTFQQALAFIRRIDEIENEPAREWLHQHNLTAEQFTQMQLEKAEGDYVRAMSRQAVRS